MRVVLLAFLLLTGCSGLIDGNNGGNEDPAAKAQRLWLTRALPGLEANCASCHDGSVTDTTALPSPDFLLGTSDLGIHDTLINNQPPEVDLNSPPQSHLLTRGAHDGPALDAVVAGDILEWINAEKEAQGVETVIIGVTPKVAMLCSVGNPGDPTCPINNFPLDEVGATGATIDFVIQSVSGATYITNLKVTPGASGVFFNHPLFVTYPATVDETRVGCQPDAMAMTFCGDSIDRFSAVTKNLAMGTPAEVLAGDGTASFNDFVPTDPISIHFVEAGAFKP